MVEENFEEFEKAFNDDANASTGESMDIPEAMEEGDLIADNKRGFVYDITKAPKGSKGPERIDLDGKKVTIEKVEIIIPPMDTAWEVAKSNKSIRYKPCTFVVYYDIEGQREYYSGVKVFERVENGKSKYSHPMIQNNGSSQASKLKTVYAEYKKKKPEEISMHEFLSFLNSKPKALIKAEEFEFNGKKTKKNIITKFI
jgi:hypothetical protein